jgi:type II restriction enzyme
MKFDVVVGNPPYQESAKGESTKDTPIYPAFYDLAERVSDRYSLISPGRFLFNAGSTDKKWNDKMLSDPHLKVQFYEQDSTAVFPGTDIKGGVAIIYRNVNSSYEPIGTFTVFDELNSILKKVVKRMDRGLDSIVSNRGQYRYSDAIYEDHPTLMKKISDRRIASNAFKNLPTIFCDGEKLNPELFVKMFGRVSNERLYKWIDKKYLSAPPNINSYKVVLPKANGSGVLGEALSSPMVMPPGVGFTETFISIGEFEKQEEAQNALIYIKSKFARLMLAILKITQDNTSDKWRYVPLLDFSASSDIDWSLPSKDVDRSLFVKFGLSENEIRFVEDKVKPME